MKQAFVPLALMCSSCAPQLATERIDRDPVTMTVTSEEDGCAVALEGRRFVGRWAESPDLLQDLRRLRKYTIVLRFSGSVQYRCIGSAIITLQRARAKFVIPQLHS